MLLPVVLIQALLLALPGSTREWVVDEPHGPTSVLEQTFSEGTWISPDVSPDGQSVVFDLLGHLYVVPFAGGRAERITDGRSWNMFPRWSPDGERIAFTSDRSGVNDLWTLRPDKLTEPMQNVSDHELPVFQGTWSADGRALYGTVLNLDVQLSGWRFSRVGSRQEVLPNAARTPVIHFQENPRDGRLYYVQADGSLPRSGPRVRAFDMETGEGRDVALRPGGAAAARLSPDGTQLAYVHRDDQDTVLMVMQLESGAHREIRRGLDRGRFDSRSFYGAYSNLSWHPDGRQLVLSWGGGLHAVDVATGEARPIPFEADVRRELDATLRFEVDVPGEGTQRTRSHRWASRSEDGVLYETLGDLWRTSDEGAPVRLTDSEEHETSPITLPDGRLAWASWNDQSLGAVFVGDPSMGVEDATRLPGPSSQYGSLTAAASEDGSLLLAAVCGAEDLLLGTHLEDQTAFKVLVWRLASDAAVEAPTEVTDIRWLRNRYSKRPPALRLEPDRGGLLYTEYEADSLLLKRIDISGGNDRQLYEFPNATRAVVSPDLRWVAFREHHRSWVTPFEPMGTPLVVSSTDELGLSLRVDPEDGDFMVWSPDGTSLGWTRGGQFYEKDVAEIVRGSARRRRTPLAVEFELDVPDQTLAISGLKVLVMDEAGTELEDATLVVTGNRIQAVGPDAEVPEGAFHVHLPGRVVMPGLLDAHGHYGGEISALNVIEQAPYGLEANLAYGVTTMVDVYGTTQKDFWLDDMRRAGKLRAPRIYSVGDPIFVTRYRKKMYRPIHSAEDAAEHARFNADHGATALKDYSNHRRDARQQLAQAARAQGLNLVTESFGDPQMNLTQLVDGFTGIEHTLGLTNLYGDVAALFGATEAALTPTLVVVYDGPAGDGYFHLRERLWEDEKLLSFYRKDELLGYRRPTHHFDDEWNFERMGQALRVLHDAGTKLTMGAHGQMMGLGAHWEMELLHMAGFTPREVLRMATINGYWHHGLDHELGTVEAGKLADLVILSADPTEDIRNTRAVELVMVNGTLYDGLDAATLLPLPTPPSRMYFKHGER
jgi:imidazolonepropionase-like amidohydrolase/WD40 repeat protein